MDSTFKWPICKFAILFACADLDQKLRGAEKIIEGRKDHKNVSHVVSALHAIFGGCRHTTTYDYITSS